MRLLTLCLILSVQLVRAQTPVSPSAGATTVSAAMSADEKAVLAVEKQRFDAQVSKDYAVLEKVLANDLIYTHSSGNVDGKQAYIQSIRDGKSNYGSVDVQAYVVELFGGHGWIASPARERAWSVAAARTRGASTFTRWVR